ncbi:MAG: hypothetical protein AB1649_19180, partial [Chloroflexota bacterium]
FHALLGKYDYQKIISDAIVEKRLGDAKAYLKDLQESQSDAVYFCSPAEIYRIQAKIALSETTPDYQKAIDQLGKAITVEPQNLFLHLELARVYKQFTAHSQHMMLAETAHARATELSNWRSDLLAEWLAVLRQLPPHKWIEHTRQIPWAKRSELVFELRASGYLELRQYDKVWDECADFFDRFRFDPHMYEIAGKAAENIPPLDLITWKHQRPNAEKIYAMVSLVWERNGNMELAAECYARAVGLWQESE